jgi:hypothetical protein
MMNPMVIEEAFREYAKDIERQAPDWVIHVDLALLHQEKILEESSAETDSRGVEEKIAERFHVIESPEKVTLFNDQFSVWIVPRVVNGRPETYTMVALNRQGKPHLELVFETSGVFNTPSHILRILEHYLEEVIENEAELRSIERKAM